MTRLSEALNRAGAKVDGENAVPSGRAAELPEDWQFEGSAPPPIDDPEPTGEPGGRFALRTDADAPEGDLVEREQVDYPFVGPDLADKLIVGSQVESVFVEQYRRLAASLHHAQLQNNARTVMITSAVESEGKTLTAANIALTLSHSYHRNVLLIDADLRRPSAHEIFKLSNRSGLGDVLGPTAHEGKLPVKQIAPHLWVMTAGRPNPDPMGGLVSDTMRHLLAEAVDNFDWVVVDTPPVALLTDANLLASMIDVALIVVSARSTPYPLVKRALEAIGPSKVLGVVLNRADLAEASEGLSYGYGYGYSYSRPKAKTPTRTGWRFPWGRRSA